MDSNEVEIVQSTTELKHLGLLKKVVVKLLVLVLDMYDFVKENTGKLKPTVVSVENAVVAAVGPVYDEVKDLAERIIVFADDQFDKYAPYFAKKLVANIESLIIKAKPLLKIPLTIAKFVIKPVAKPLIYATSTILYYLLQIFPAPGSIPLAGETQTLVTENLNAIPLVGKTQTLLTKSLNTTKSLAGGIPVVGKVAQSIFTDPTGLANQLVDATNTLADKNPLIGAVNAATQNFVKEAQATGIKATLQAAYVSFKLVGVPVVAQLWYKLNKNPLVNALSVYILPVVEYLSEGYNNIVTYLEEKGYRISGYLPLIPVEEVKRAYKVYKTSRDGFSAVGSAVEDLFGLNK